MIPATWIVLGLLAVFVVLMMIVLWWRHEILAHRVDRVEQSLSADLDIIRTSLISIQEQTGHTQKLVLEIVRGHIDRSPR